MLVSGFWLLVSGCWFLVAGFLFLVPGWDGFRFRFTVLAGVTDGRLSLRDSATSKIFYRKSEIKNSCIPNI
jgi:hypothetical protein